jgi:Bacterial regulatory proteins, luxR family
MPLGRTPTSLLHRFRKPAPAGSCSRPRGAALFLSEPTVKAHVTRILAKLQLRDRVQAVVLAYESGLIQPGIH